MKRRKILLFILLLLPTVIFSDPVSVKDLPVGDIFFSIDYLELWYGHYINNLTMKDNVDVPIKSNTEMDPIFRDNDFSEDQTHNETNTTNISNELS